MLETQRLRPLSAGVLSRPMVASFLGTAWIMLMVCRFQLGSRQSWKALLIFAPLCLLIAAVTHAFVVWVVGGIVDVEGRALKRLRREVWVPVVWVPALMILAMAKSLWVAALLPLVVWLTAALVGRWKARASFVLPVETLWEGNLQSVFRVPDATSKLHTILPTMIVSLALQLGLIAMARRLDWVAALLFAAACVVPLPWLAKPRVRFSAKAAGAASCAALLLMILALTAFLKAGPGAVALAELLAMQKIATATVAATPMSKGAGYTGIILTQPKKPHEIIAPLLASQAQIAGQARVITFDGAYWYFKAPDTQPEVNARRADGDPIKNKIFSTNRVPLIMEAHQPLGIPVEMSCCRALRVTVQNADTASGPIALEVLLRDVSAKTPTVLSLGAQLLTSKPVAGEPAEETLTFAFTPTARGRSFNEIAVRIEPQQRLSLQGPKIAIQSFALVQ